MKNARAGILLAAVGLLVALLLIDRLFLGGGGGEAEVTDSPREAYLSKARLFEQTERLAQAREQITASAANAAADWAKIEPMLVRAQTFDLALGTFREKVQNAAADLSFKSLSVRPVQAVEPSPEAMKDQALSRLRVIEVEMRFDAANVNDVYTLIDRLENLGELRTQVARVEILGPGRQQIAGQVTVTLNVHAIAVVG